MGKFGISIVLVIAALYIFFGPTQSALSAVDPLKAEKADLEEALSNVEQIREKRDFLAGQYRSFQQADLDRLEQMLPSHVDNVRLAIDINNMASNVGMFLKDIDIRAAGNEQAGGSTRNQPGVNPGDLSHLDFRFTVSGSYEGLKILLADLARSIRIVDVTNLEFRSDDVNLYDFDVGLRTYWLSDKETQ